MKRIARLVAVAVLGWYVVTYSGQRIAGPFTLLSECKQMAEIMAERYSNVSRVCRSF